MVLEDRHLEADSVGIRSLLFPSSAGTSSRAKSYPTTTEQEPFCCEHGSITAFHYMPFVSWFLPWIWWQKHSRVVARQGGCLHDFYKLPWCSHWNVIPVDGRNGNSIHPSQRVSSCSLSNLFAKYVSFSYHAKSLRIQSVTVPSKHLPIITT